MKLSVEESFLVPCPLAKKKGTGLHCLGWYASNVSLSSILPSCTLPRLWRNGTDPTHGVADTRRMRLFHLSLGSLLQFRGGLDALSQLAVVRPSENAVTLGGPSVQCLGGPVACPDAGPFRRKPERMLAAAAFASSSIASPDARAHAFRAR